MKSFFEFLLNVKKMEVTYPYGFNPGFVIVVTVVSICLIIFMYYLTRKSSPEKRGIFPLSILRILAYILIALCVFKPVLKVVSIEKIKPALAILIDNSQSMQKERMESLKRYLWEKKILNRLGSKFKLKLYEFSGECKSVEPRQLNLALDARGVVTDVGNALRFAGIDNRKSEMAGYVLISDGCDNSGKEVVNAVSYMKSPVYCVGVSGIEMKTARDVSIRSVIVDENAIVNNTVSVDVVIGYKGARDERIRVELLQGRELVATGYAMLKDESGQTSARMEFIPKKIGRFKYTVSVPPLEGEQLMQDNVSNFTLNVREPRIRVLYVEGEWRWEYKFLKRVLEKDPNFKFEGMLSVGDGKFKIQGEADNLSGILTFPRRNEQLSGIDVVILGDVSRNSFSEEQINALSEFVSKDGGGLLTLGGMNSYRGFAGSSLEAILPVVIDERLAPVEEPFNIMVTYYGAVHPIFHVKDSAEENIEYWSQLPKNDRFNPVVRAKSGASVLAVHPKMGNDYGNFPIMAVQPYGKGKVVSMMIDTTWKWEIKKTKEVKEEELYLKFWRQTLRWLASRDKESTAIGLATDRKRYLPKEEVRVTVNVPKEMIQQGKDVEITGTVNTPDGKVMPVRFDRTEIAGEYSAIFVPIAEGDYEIFIYAKENVNLLGTRSGGFEVRRSFAELQNSEFNEKLLKQIAEATNGQYLPLEKSDLLISRIRESQKKITRTYSIDLWESGIPFLIILGLITAEWILRKRKRLT